MKARPSKQQKKNLHTPPKEFEAAGRVRQAGSWWWCRQQEAIRAAEKEKCADFKQPHRKAPPLRGGRYEDV